MKIGIVTFQETNNYGALLQNFALQIALKKLGHESETIDYKSEYIGKPCRLRHLKKKGLMKYLLGVAGYFIYLPRTRRNNRFREMIAYSSRTDAGTINRYEDSYDLYICGSDQVWNYQLTDFDPYYMLGFVKDKSKCSSYAASLGIAEIDDAHREEFSKLIEDYSVISLREESAANAIRRISKHPVEVVADPCVLLSREEWTEITGKAPDYPYVYVYQLGVSKDVVALAKKLAKENGCKLIFTPFPVGQFAPGKYHISAGCQDVVTYIKNAEYVVTDSFHGTLLSILFHKKFFTKAGGTHGVVGNRIVDLLKSYSLSERLISKDSNPYEEIDYEIVEEKIKESRQKGYEVLEKICNI